MVQVSDYYAVLGVNPHADSKAIRSAYRRLARRYHPDVAKSHQAARRFLLIREAYEVLSDPEQRRQYDELIAKPALASRPTRSRITRPGPTPASPIAVRARRRSFRLILDALGILRLDAGISFGSRSSRPGGRQPRTKANKRKK